MKTYLLSYKWKAGAFATHEEIKQKLIDGGWNASISIENQMITVNTEILKSFPNTTLLGEFSSAQNALANIEENIKSLYHDKDKANNTFGSNSGSFIQDYLRAINDNGKHALEDYIIVEVGKDNLIKQQELP